MGSIVLFKNFKLNPAVYPQVQLIFGFRACLIIFNKNFLLKEFCFQSVRGSKKSGDSRDGLSPAV